ncbi:MAG: helix-turn-helix transcriptional regulator [Clostridia bacterium]|nr:helix-turn-helix transcriptional regulator [Clostridia bacterium]
MKAFTEKIEFEDRAFRLLAGRRPPSGDAAGAFHEELELKYYFNGGNAVMINGSLILADAGDITVANPYEIHSNLHTDGGGGDYIIIMIGLDFLAGTDDLPDLRELLIGGNKRFNNHIKGNAHLSGLMRAISDEMLHRSDYYRPVTRALVTELVAYLLRNECAEREGEHNRPRDPRGIRLISAALDKIHADYAERLTVDGLAALCNVSRFHFCHSFKEAVGETPIAYLNHYRIHVAEALLRSTDKSISEIAWQCGFSDESYFYRCYKSITGTRPGSIRRQRNK